MARLQKRIRTKQHNGRWVFHESNTDNDAKNTLLVTMDHPTADLASSNDNNNNTGASASDTKFDYGSDSDDDNEDNTRRDSSGASALHRDGSDTVCNDPSSNNNSPGARTLHRHGSDAIRDDARNNNEKDASAVHGNEEVNNMSVDGDDKDENNNSNTSKKDASTSLKEDDQNKNAPVESGKRILQNREKSLDHENDASVTVHEKGEHNS
jgi:hypothetical protein